jgi:hypothetical protein
VAEVVVRLCDLRLETYPASLKRGPLLDICLPPILYATRNPPKLADNMGLCLHGPPCQRPQSKCRLPNFHFVVREVESGIFKFCLPSPRPNTKYSTPLLPCCATKLPPSISKKHHYAQLDIRWRSDLTVAGGGGGVSQ